MKYFFLVIVVCMSTLLVFNLRMDVAGFRTGEVYPLASRQTTGQTMVSDRDYDQRSWVRARLHAHCPELLILGSSTVGTLDKRALGQADLLNGWLTGPTVEDLEALAEVLREEDCKPARVVVAVDPFFVNPKVTSSRWRTVEPWQRRFTGGKPLFAEFETVKGHWLRFTDLLAFQTTRDGVKLLASGSSEARGPHLVDSLTEYCAATAHPQSVRHLDGHFSYCSRWLKTPDAVGDIARTYVQRDVHKIRSWNSVSKSRLVRLQRVLGHLAARGAKLLIVAPTYHPFTYRALRADPRIAGLLEDMDAALAALAKETRADWLSLRDPDALGCPASQFFDSHHPGPECARRMGAAITARLLTARPATDIGSSR